MNKDYIVAKFGGSSIADIDAINKAVIAIKESYSLIKNNLCIVFSAHGGVTDKLISLYHLALQKGDTDGEITELERRHHSIANHFLSPKNRIEIKKQYQKYFQKLKDLCFSIKTLGEYNEKINDKLIGYGEMLSNTFFTYFLGQLFKEVCFLDTREVIKTNSDYGQAVVNFKKTKQLIRDFFKGKSGIVVTTGFIASDDKGFTTTLGRSGSDYTASIIAEAISADKLDIWTDVDGVMTTDPRKESNAYYLPKISYEEAMEMSHFGAKVIFSSTMLPAMRKNIPIAIKNTFNSKHAGTIIHKIKKAEKYDTVKGVSAISDISLLRLQGIGLISKSDISQRFFKVLSENNTNIILISQASSVYSLSICTTTKEAQKVLPQVNIEFEKEIKSKLIEPCIAQEELAIVAVIGKGIKRKVGSAGKLFTALGSAGINVIAIAQGASELNISAVIKQKNLNKSISVLHDAFFLTNTKKVYLFVFGIGQIGKKVIEIVANQYDGVLKNHGMKLIIAGYANSKTMDIDEKGFDFTPPFDLKTLKGKPSNMNAFVDQMLNLNKANSVFVDCTSNKDIIKYYPAILEKGISIATPNKKANSSNYKLYKNLKKFSSKHYNRFHYETNVAAGLPIINTIKDLVLSGDEITNIEAVLSGSLNYLFSNYDASVPFSELVKQAKASGYTEPDPREDLNGMDVARKILILIREIGKEMELKNIKVKSLISQKLKNIKEAEVFIQELSTMDDYYYKLFQQAKHNNKRLRYAARYDGKKAEVGILEVDDKHPFYRLKGTDNLVIITSKRYKSQPMIVKGPGAGIDVTSAGVFADIIRAVKHN